MLCYNFIMCFKIKYIYKINRDIIFQYMIDNNLDIKKFCNKCHITLKEFSNLMKNDPYINTIIFAKVITVLEIELIDLIE